jgi:hypothetical protein
MEKIQQQIQLIYAGTFHKYNRKSEIVKRFEGIIRDEKEVACQKSEKAAEKSEFCQKKIAKKLWLDKNGVFL